MWKDLEAFLSHASFSNKHGDAEIPMACPEEKEAVGMQEAEGGGRTYKKVVGGKEEKSVELQARDFKFSAGKGKERYIVLNF